MGQRICFLTKTSQTSCQWVWNTWPSHTTICLILVSCSTCLLAKIFWQLVRTSPIIFVLCWVHWMTNGLWKRSDSTVNFFSLYPRLTTSFVQGRALEITFFAIQIHGRKRIGLVMANTFSGGNKGTMYLHKTIQWKLFDRVTISYLYVWPKVDCWSGLLFVFSNTN